MACDIVIVVRVQKLRCVSVKHLSTERSQFHLLQLLNLVVASDHVDRDGNSFLPVVALLSSVVDIAAITHTQSTSISCIYRRTKN